jgi:hypothetical protein
MARRETSAAKERKASRLGTDDFVFPAPAVRRFENCQKGKTG